MSLSLPAAVCLAAALSPWSVALQSAPDETADVSTEASAPAWALRDAAALAPLVDTPVAEGFLAAARHLPAGEARTLHRDAEGRWLDPDAVAALDDEDRAALQTFARDAEQFYTTRYGSPLAYVRALEVLGDHGLESLAGKRVLDFGAGTLGHLRLMALCGADATGVDVDPYLGALYDAPDDHGPLGDGSARLTLGRWPGERPTRAAVGVGFDVFTSKNTLKRGYVHPEREVDPRMTIDLGVDDATFLGALFDALNPGGLVVLYNLCPAMAADDEPYIPWADGRSPWTREQWTAAGFELLAFDVVDDTAARAMGAALGWADTPEELDADLFAWFSVARRPVD